MDDSLVPPLELRRFVGPFDDPEDYRASAHELLRVIRALGGLKPSDRVLDVGCGCGRVAAVLTDYLDPASRYDGIDVGEAAVAWCRDAIVPRFPNFHFHLLDAANRVYNPDGRAEAARAGFPFDDAAFDFAIANSLYTHLLHEDAGHYLRETARVLRPGGTLFATFFLLNARSREGLAGGRSPLDFRHRFGPCWSTNAEAPEAAVAYEEEHALGLLAGAGFQLQAPVRYGNWPTTPGHQITQDVVVAKRASSARPAKAPSARGAPRPARGRSAGPTRTIRRRRCEP